MKIKICEEGCGGYDHERPSLATVASDGEGNGAVIWWAGRHLDLEIQEYGLRRLDDLGLDDCPAGVWVWEGKYIYRQCSTPDGIDEGADAEPKGRFRRPTDEEWAAIRECRSPWSDDDWRIR